MLGANTDHCLALHLPVSKVSPHLSASHRPHSVAQTSKRVFIPSPFPTSAGFWTRDCLTWTLTAGHSRKRHGKRQCACTELQSSRPQWEARKIRIAVTYRVGRMDSQSASTWHLVEMIICPIRFGCTTSNYFTNSRAYFSWNSLANRWPAATPRLVGAFCYINTGSC